MCKQRKKSAASTGDEQQNMLASLTASMNSWSDFDTAPSTSAPKTKNSAKQKTKRKGKDGKIYLRDGPKRNAAVSKLDKRRMSTDASTGAPPDVAGTTSKVRIEESKSGGAGKKTTIIRGLPGEEAKSVLKEMKAAFSVGGRVNARGEVELQGTHAEVCLIRLQKAGYADVRLAGGAGAKKGSAAAKWNAPKEVKDRAAAQKQRAQETKQKQAEKARRAANSPAAVNAKMLAQLRASEQIEVQKLRRSDVPQKEKQQAKEKLERIQRRIDEATSS